MMSLKPDGELMIKTYKYDESLERKSKCVYSWPGHSAISICTNVIYENYCTSN